MDAEVDTRESSQLDVARTLTEFARTLADRGSVAEVFEALADYTTVLLGVDGVGVLLLEEGSLAVATASTELARGVEHLEAKLAEGPCTDSIRSAAHVLVPDLREALDRYPSFAPQALELGAVGIHGLPLGGRSNLPIGSIDIITTEPLVLTEVGLRTADMLAEVAVSYLVTIRAHEDANQLATQLQTALDSRIVIEQAKGVLAGRHTVTLDDAFERIRGYARQRGIAIRQVAEQIRQGELDLP
jgi:hypothetical protein